MAYLLRTLASSKIVTRSMQSTSTTPAVKHDRKNREFYLQMGNDKALLKYEEIKPGLLNLVHTQVPPVFRGQGVAAMLATEAFDFLVKNNLKTRVTCTYLLSFLQKDSGKPYLNCVVAD